MTDDETLGQRLTRRRWEELRVLQRDLAAAARVSRGYLSELEHDTARATEPTLRRLALALALPEFALVEQARREGRLSTNFGARTNRAVSIAEGELPRMPPAPPRPHPESAWLTSAEAARVMGLSSGYVSALAQDGALCPAHRVRLPGQRGPARWLIAAEAASAYWSPSEGFAKRRSEDAPAGYLSVRAFQDASGLSYGSLHRRLEANVIASVWIGPRRFIPEGELTRWREQSDEVA